MRPPTTVRLSVVLVGGYWAGAEGQSRTGDTGIFSAVLYHLSYLGLPNYRTEALPQCQERSFWSLLGKRCQIYDYLEARAASCFSFSISASGGPTSPGTISPGVPKAW